MLSQEEIVRYKRQLSLPGFGEKSQEQLKAASVLVIGAGGLGSPVLLYLSAAGVGTIGIVDHDKVDISNLQRQILYTVDDIGKFKAVAAANRISQLNPNTKVNVISEQLQNKNALQHINQYDIIVDCTDNFATRYLINDACVLLEKPCVSGSVFRFEGQVIVLNSLQKDGSRGPDYRQLFPYSSKKENGIDCNSAGVLGVLPGIIGTLQATEVIKLITQTGEVLSGELLLIESLSMQILKIKLPSIPSDERKPKNRNEFEQWNYAGEPCEYNQTISPDELAVLLANPVQPVVIDVRMPMEYPEADGIVALNIPLPILEQQIGQIPNTEVIIFFCKSGQRSAKAVEIASKYLSPKSLYSLKGGIEEWNRIVENNLKQKK